MAPRDPGVHCAERDPPLGSTRAELQSHLLKEFLDLVHLTGPQDPRTPLRVHVLKDSDIVEQSVKSQTPLEPLNTTLPFHPLSQVVDICSQTCEFPLTSGLTDYEVYSCMECFSVVVTFIIINIIMII